MPFEVELSEFPRPMDLASLLQILPFVQPSLQARLLALPVLVVPIPLALELARPSKEALAMPMRSVTSTDHSDAQP